MVWPTALAIIVPVVSVGGSGLGAVPRWRGVVSRCGGIALLVAAADVVGAVAAAFVVDGAEMIRAPRAIGVRHLAWTADWGLVGSRCSGPAVLCAAVGDRVECRVPGLRKRRRNAFTISGTSGTRFSCLCRTCRRMCVHSARRPPNPPHQLGLLCGRVYLVSLRGSSSSLDQNTSQAAAGFQTKTKVGDEHG